MNEGSEAPAAQAKKKKTARRGAEVQASLNLARELTKPRPHQEPSTHLPRPFGACAGGSLRRPLTRSSSEPPDGRHQPKEVATMHWCFLRNRDGSTSNVKMYQGSEVGRKLKKINVMTYPRRRGGLSHQHRGLPQNAAGSHSSDSRINTKGTKNGLEGTRGWLCHRLYCRRWCLGMERISRRRTTGRPGHDYCVQRG